MRTAGQGPGGFEKRDGFIKPGQDLVVAGYAGMAGARLIFQKKKEKLEVRFAPSFLRCLEKEDSYNVKEWLENELKAERLSSYSLGIRERRRHSHSCLEFIRHFQRRRRY